MSNNPFCQSKFIGYVSLVNPQITKIHFPSSTLLNSYSHKGDTYLGGIVGNYIVIEGETYGFIGKLVEVDLPESERLRLNEKAFNSKDFHPVGKVELLMSFDMFDVDRVSLGLDCFPAVGAKAFVCSSVFFQRYLVKFGDKLKSEDPPLIDLGVLTSDSSTKLTVSQQALFGRHCAIIGTTGGGKSWTVKTLLEKAAKNNTKVILLDSTGEYSNHGIEKSIDCIIGKNSFFHYSNLTIDDLFFLVKPSGRAQAPKLMDAITSLKIVKLIEVQGDVVEGIYINENGNIEKANQFTKPYNAFSYRNIEKIDLPKLDLDITKLESQIQYECVFNNGEKYGNRSEQELANCISMISRIKSIIQNPTFKKAFGLTPITKGVDLGDKINKFIENDDCLLRIGFENVSFQSQYREILANAIASNLLNRARNGDFRLNPTIFFIDEAHQYLNKNVSDEYFGSQSLDAYDQIAKECRKYGLFLCLATQMPRDIPVGTLSQMGTFIVHRLINYQDKEAIANACSSANRSALSFLPVLGEGEAILTGVDFPMPVTIKINKPKIPPESETPQFKLKKEKHK